MGSEQGRLSVGIWTEDNTAHTFQADHVFFVNAQTHGDPVKLCELSGGQADDAYSTLFVNPDALLALTISERS